MDTRLACVKCGHRWLKRLQSQADPKRCTNPACRSTLWRGAVAIPAKGKRQPKPVAAPVPKVKKSRHHVDKARLHPKAKALAVVERSDLDANQDWGA